MLSAYNAFWKTPLSAHLINNIIQIKRRSFTIFDKRTENFNHCPKVWKKLRKFFLLKNK